MSAKRRPRRKVAPFNHEIMVKYWHLEEQQHLAATRIVPTRFQRLEKKLSVHVERQGDILVTKVKDLFHNGYGLKFGDDQIRVFNAFLGSCLPLIYRESWPENKTRVLYEWGLQREIMYSLVNMARRNGKTFVTSATAAALLLCVPGIMIAIFSTCKRTSQLMLQACIDQIERAFDKGTHACREDFVVVTKNMESISFEGPDGTKRTIASFPGSVRVSVLFFLVGGGGRGTKTKSKVSKNKRHFKKKLMCASTTLCALAQEVNLRGRKETLH